MIVDSKGADPASADVFSLAKTLWVLCMDSGAPQGEQHASNSAYSIGSIRPHPLAHHLDELIERCTRHEPSKRPSMRQVTEDLRAWLALGEKTPQQSVDLSAMWSRLRETAEPRLRQVNEEATLRLCFQAAVRRLQELLAPLHAEIRQEFPATAFNERPKFVETMFFDTLKREITNEDIRATILSGPGWDPILLIIGLSVRTRVSGELEFGSMFYLGSIKTMGGHLNSWRSERQRVPCGSILVEERLVALAEEVQGMFPLGWNSSSRRWVLTKPDVSVMPTRYMRTKRLSSRLCTAPRPIHLSKDGAAYRPIRPTTTLPFGLSPGQFSSAKLGLDRIGVNAMAEKTSIVNEGREEGRREAGPLHRLQP